MEFVWQVEGDIRNSVADPDPYVFLGLPESDPIPPILKQK